MGKSARVLGEEYGLNAQEMNRILKKQGFLDGGPGGYSLTEKGEQFGEQRYIFSGPRSGYDLITFDESIKEELNITKELRAEVRAEMEEERLQRKAEAQETENVEDDTDEENIDIEESDDNEDESIEDKEGEGEGDINVALLVTGLITIGTALYKGRHIAAKGVNRFKIWLEDQKTKKQAKTKKDKQENKKKKKLVDR